MSNGNNNNNKNNNKLNELSAFLSTNSSILESQQQQNAMFGNVGSLTLVQQSQNQNAASSMPLFIGKNGKPTRPFKAYPKESLSIPIVGSGNSSATISELINNGNSNNNNNNNNASSNNQKVILSANINALAHLLSQQHQMGNSGYG